MPDRRQLPPVSTCAYHAFVDPAGGSGPDSMTLAIAHAEARDGRTTVVLDALCEARPPFSPEVAVWDFAAVLRTYRVGAVVGDRFAGEWPREALRRAGIAYDLSERAKSELYRDTLPLLNAGVLELLDDRRLHAQWIGLERRVGRSGRDSINHAPDGHDDLANAAAGALLLAHRAATRPTELHLISAGSLYVDEESPEFQAKVTAIRRGYAGSA